jgi:DNA-binding MarR family transcriptional regulator
MSGKVPNRQHAVKSGEAFSRLVVDVFRLNGMLSAAGDALAAPAGQTTARWRVLAAVEEAPKTVAQIARDWSLARQSVQRVADLLERDGLIAYEDNPAHRRASLVRPTPEGRAGLHTIQQAQRAWATAVGDAVGARDLERASGILARVMDAIASEGARAA